VQLLHFFLKNEQKTVRDGVEKNDKHLSNNAKKSGMAIASLQMTSTLS